MLTVNDLIGLNYSNLRNPVTPSSNVGIANPNLITGNPTITTDINMNQPQPNLGFFDANRIPQPILSEGIVPLLDDSTSLSMLGDPGPTMKNIDAGGQIFAPGDPRIQEASNFMAKKNLLQRFTPQAVRTGLGLLATSMGVPKIVAAAATPFRGLGNLLTNLQSSTFGRSRNFAEYLANKRAQKIARQVAERGAAKQKAIIASQQVDTGGGEGSRPGGFGQGAGDFSPSNPTATEGSF